MNPKVSVIVPIYKVEPFIRKCLESLRTQTYANLEVLMVNDGSPDNSPAICQEFAEMDSRFVLLNKENGGLSSARNLGLDHATGDFVSFVDSDDWVCENFVASLMAAVDEETDVVISRYILDDRNIGRNYIPYKDNTVNRAFSGEEKLKQIVYNHMDAYLPGEAYQIRYSIMPVWKNLYRRSFIEENSLRFVSERKVYAEDYLFNLEAYILARKIFVSDAAEYVHLIVKGSLSQGYRKNMLEMTACRYQHEHEIVSRLLGEEAAALARHKLPSAIAHAALHSCRSDYKTSLAHIQEIMADPFCQSVFAENHRVRVARNKPIYFLLRKKQTALCVLFIKTMLLGEGIYRFTRRFTQR